MSEPVVTPAPVLTDVAAMGTAVDAALDSRFAAALALQAAEVLASPSDQADLDTATRLTLSRRRSFAWTVLKAPVAVAKQARWVLAAAPLPLLSTFKAGGSAAITDAELRSAARVLWDHLAEA